MTASKISRGFFLILLACLHLTPAFAADGPAPAFTLKDATGEEVSRAYGVRVTPTTFFINASGEIVGMTNASKPDDPELIQLAEQAALTAD